MDLGYKANHYPSWNRIISAGFYVQKRFWGDWSDFNVQFSTRDTPHTTNPWGLYEGLITNIGNNRFVKTRYNPQQHMFCYGYKFTRRYREIWTNVQTETCHRGQLRTLQMKYKIRRCKTQYQLRCKMKKPNKRHLTELKDQDTRRQTPIDKRRKGWYSSRPR